MSIFPVGMWLYFGICVPHWLLSTGMWKSVVGIILLAGSCRDENGMVLAMYSICSVSDSVIGDSDC